MQVLAATLNASVGLLVIPSSPAHCSSSAPCRKSTISSALSCNTHVTDALVCPYSL